MGLRRTEAVDPARLTRWYDAQARFYHLWRDRYDGPLVRAVCRFLEAPGTGTVLDAGCGGGLFTIGPARRLPACRFVGVDRAARLVAIARREAARRRLPNATFVLGDAARLPFGDGVFDAVLAGGLLPLVNDRAALLAELRRVLRARGRVVFAEFDAANMTAATRLFFHGMIWGYRAVCWWRPGFRYAPRVTTGNSTVPRAELRQWLLDRGFVPDGEQQAGGHYLLAASRGGGHGHRG